MSNESTYPLSPRGPAEHDVREQIITAAMEHFRLYGYEKTTVSDLAKAIGFSKAYIYKFFESKQAIGEAICSNCTLAIEVEVRQAIEQTDKPPEKLRRMFKTLLEACLRLFFKDRKLHELTATATGERWQVTKTYEDRLKSMILEILQAGRESGDFERKTPLDETAAAIFLVMRPYGNPLLLQHSLEDVAEVPGQLASLVLRSLSP